MTTFIVRGAMLAGAVPCSATLGLEFGRLARDAVHTAMRGYTGVCVGHGTWDMEHAHSEFGYLLNSLLQGKTRIESYIDRDLNVFLSDYRKGQFTTSSRDSQIDLQTFLFFSNC